MSILIKGMEMPTEQYGKMVITLYPNGHVAEYIGDIGRVLEAVPVPLHGRLGDLDALEKILKEKQAKYKARDLLATHELSEAMRMGFDAAVGHVLMAPTIIPAEGGDK